MPVRSSIIPCLIYADAPRAIDFLCDAFGLGRHLVVPGEAPGEIAHAQLRLGDSLVMLSSPSAASRDRFAMVTPQAAGGRVTASIYVTIDDVDAHHATAQAAGAVIIDVPRDNDYGGRGYSARDLEGNVWSFGSYDPWQ